jgi:adenine-specific DNA-methyltransferase
MPMSQNLERLKRLLAELCQLDQAELDFGLYRIMNTKREEIVRFLANDLLPQVREVLSAYERESRAALQAELEKAKEQAKSLGFEDPAQAPKVKELEARWNAAFDVEAAESEVFSHLYSFFRRYYQEGDFISLRRYKEGVYAIPYKGKEVKLYWANHDQYSIKTSEDLRNYTFKLPSGKRVHFKLLEADTEKDNNRAASGNQRRFISAADEPLKNTHNDKLDDWLQKQGYNTKDQEFDHIYLNGDNNLENLNEPDQTWKVRLSEDEFLRGSFAVQDV